jgi:predicted metal-dependent phosphoesterase TrpH
MTRIEFDNPFAAPGRWWKGNLHCHTVRSDGALSPEETARRYRALGYDFLAITDHLVISQPFEPPPGLLLVPGAEYHTVEGAPPRAWHFVSLGTKAPVEGAMGPMEPLLENVRRHSEFWWLAHPNWSNLAEDDLLDVPGCPATEVYNAVCERAIARGYSQPAWDRALAGRRRMNGLAVDDTHVPEEIGRGRIMLRAEKLTLETLYDALRRGQWYATNGPEIHDVRLAGSTVSVRTSPARAVSFIARSPDGKRFAAKEGRSIETAEYEIKGTETYLRIEVEDAEGRRAFTNPMYVSSEGGPSR